jgi:hypothetical protein
MTYRVTASKERGRHFASSSRVLICRNPATPVTNVRTENGNVTDSRYMDLLLRPKVVYLVYFKVIRRDVKHLISSIDPHKNTLCDTASSVWRVFSLDRSGYMARS